MDSMENRRRSKRPRTAYILFCKAMWKKVMCDLKTRESKIVIRELAKRWRRLNECDRKKYQEMAMKEKRAKAAKKRGCA